MTHTQSGHLRRCRWLVLLLATAVPPACASFDRTEPLLYPAGFPTAQVLREDEWMVAPPPWGWMAYGATPRVTVGFDYPAALMGFPAGLVRYQFAGDQQSAVNYAIEGYTAIFTRDHTDERNAGYKLERNGTQDWLHLERTQQLSERWKSHLYAGFNFATFQRYVPNEQVQFEPVEYRNHVNPDLGVAFQWDATDAMKVHFNYSYGNTLYFVDQVALKHLAAATLHFAPFSGSGTGLWRNLRFDLNALYVNVPIAQYKEVLPLPLYPTVYWQWGGD